MSTPTSLAENHPEDLPENISPMHETADLPGNPPEERETVSQTSIIETFKNGGDFNSCLCKAFPMTHDEIRSGPHRHLLSHNAPEVIHARIAHKKLRESGFFEDARLAFITGERDKCLQRGQSLLDNGQWQNMSDTVAYILLSEGHGTGERGFENKCGDLFASTDPVIGATEYAAYHNYRETFYKSLQEELEKMFYPLHAVVDLRHVEEYIANSKNGVFGPNDWNVGPYQGLKRLTQDIKRAKSLYPAGVPETYFSDAIQSAGDKLRDKPSNTSTTSTEANEMAKTLAQIIIRSEHKELQRKDPASTKDKLVKNVEKALEETGFTLESCGFTVKDKTTGILAWKKVVGYELVEQK